MNCPKEFSLVSYMTQSGSRKELDEIGIHLAECSKCQKVLDGLHKEIDSHKNKLDRQFEILKKKMSQEIPIHQVITQSKEPFFYTRRTWFLMSLAAVAFMGIVFFFCAFFGHQTALSAQFLGIGIIQVDRLNFRSKPDLKSHSYKKLEKGTQVKIVRSQNGWLKIYHAGKIGYIVDNKKYVKILEQSERKTNKNSVASLKKESQKINHELTSHQKDFAKFKKKETEIIDALNRIDFDLNATRKQILKIEFIKM